MDKQQQWVEVGNYMEGRDVDFSAFLDGFTSHGVLRSRIAKVLHELPREVIADFVGDPRFSVAIENYVPGEGSSVWMACPGAHGEGSRSVILRPRLNEGDESFALYVIAHEFAHAYLRNGGWGAIDEPEAAADALAAQWGFPKP